MLAEDNKKLSNWMLSKEGSLDYYKVSFQGEGGGEKVIEEKDEKIRMLERQVEWP